MHTDANAANNPHAHTYTLSYTYSHANGNTNTAANSDGYRPSQDYAAASSYAAAAPDAISTAGSNLNPNASRYAKDNTPASPDSAGIGESSTCRLYLPSGLVYLGAGVHLGETARGIVATGELTTASP